MVEINNYKENCEKAILLLLILSILFLYIDSLIKSIRYNKYIYNITEQFNNKMFRSKKPSYCDDPNYIKNRKLIHSGSSGAEDGCQENFSNTIKDVYGFNTLNPSKLNEETTDYRIKKLPDDRRMKKYNIPLPSDNSLNQLLSTDKQFFQELENHNYVENEEFKQYWSEFGLTPSNTTITENFTARTPSSFKNKKNGKITIETLENQHVDNLGKYVKKVKEPINFDTYKPLFSHAGVIDENLLPPNFGTLHHQYLDRFKYAPPLSDMEPHYDIPYEFKKETQNDKEGYSDFLRENFIDSKIKSNHKSFVKQLKEKNISCNKVKEKMVLSGDNNICGSPLARDCFSPLGTCGPYSYNKDRNSYDSYKQHHNFCKDYCKPVEMCRDYP